MSSQAKKKGPLSSPSRWNAIKPLKNYNFWEVWIDIKEHKILTAIKRHKLLKNIYFFIVDIVYSA